MAISGVSLKSILDGISSKEHRDWLEAKVKDRDNKIAELERENIDLLRENRELKKQVEALTPNEKFINGGLCLFRVAENGEFDGTPLCHKCKLPVAQVPGMRAKWMCTGCEAVFGHEAILAPERRPVQFTKASDCGHAF